MKHVKQAQTVKSKSMKVSLFVHASILALGFLPFAAQQLDITEDQMQFIPIQFAEFASQSEGLQARSEKVVDQVKPVTEKPKEVVGTDHPEPAEELVPVTEEVEIESEIVEDEVTEVEASENSEDVEAEDAAAQGGFEATNMQGNAEGSSDEGADSGSNGIDGDGIITRRIIHRENISKVAYESGVIVLNLCIDRWGKIREIKHNAEESTIEDMKMVKDAMQVALGYRFEKDFNAAVRECGKITFIFDVEQARTEEVIAMQ